MLLAHLAETIHRYRMLQPGQHVGVAVSGGADSVGLLHLLVELAPQLNLRLSVLHLNHGLRGEESLGDEQFVRDLAARLNLPATIRTADLADTADNLEQAARDARLAFFREELAGGRVDRIALGHTRNDQAETVLFRLLRGAGGAGIAAIRPVTRDGRVRPLIETERSRIVEYLTARGLAWREDSSNASLEFARNRIRHQLLPQLAREWNPAIAGALSRTADWALAEEEYWAAEIARLSAGQVVVREGAVLVPAAWLCGLPLAASRRVVRHAIGQCKGDLRGIDFSHVSAVLKLAASEAGRGRVEAPGVKVRRSFDWLRFSLCAADNRAAIGYSLAAPVPGTVRIPGTGLSISLELVEKAETSSPPDCVYNVGTGCVDWRSLSGSLEIRNWRPGDRYQPWGSSSEKKIKTLFQKARIPQWERCRWPVVAEGSQIVWAKQFGPAARFSAGSECPVVLRIRESETASGDFGIGIAQDGV